MKLTRAGLSGLGFTLFLSSLFVSPEGQSQTPAPFPSDIDPVSRSRFPLVNRETLTPEQQKIYDRASAPGSASLAGLNGPGGIKLHGSPPGQVGDQLGAGLKHLAILVAAREMNQQYEWTLHEPEAVKGGISPQVIDVVRHRKPLGKIGENGMGEKEAAIIRLGRELFQTHNLRSESFAAAKKALGERDLVDATQIMGQYAGTAILLHMADARLAPDRKPLLPMK